MKKSIIAASAIWLLCSSCSQHILLPAMYSADISYQPKPTSFDTVKSVLYVSGGLGASETSNNNDYLSFGELNISRAHVYKALNLSYGVFGYGGSISNSSYNSTGNNTSLGNYDSKSFYGYGGRFSINTYEHQGNADVRYIGLEAAYSREFGDYAAFRQKVNGLDNFYSNPHTQVFTVGLTTETVWHRRSNTDMQFGVRGLIGGTFYNNVYITNADGYNSNNTPPIYLSGSFFMQMHKFFGVIELTKEMNVLLPNFRFKLGKRF